MSLLSGAARIASTPFKAAWTCFLKSQSSVEQDYKMLMFTEYRGVKVRMVPVMDPGRNGWVKMWIADPDACVRRDKEIAGGSGMQTGSVSNATTSKTADPLSSFNPANAVGL